MPIRCIDERASLVLFALIVFALTAPSATAAAQDSAPDSAGQQAPTDQELERFKQMVKEGAELRDAGELFAARERLEQARQILDHPKLTFGVGKLYQQTGACAEARSYYRDVLGRPKLPDDLRAEVVRQLETTDTCREFATLTVTCSPADAEVAIDDARHACPLDQEKVAAGTVEMAVQAPGYDDEVVSLQLEPGARAERHVELREESVDAPPAAQASTPWQSYAAYGAVGVGGALLVGGVVSDWGAQARAEDFVAANNAGDRSRAATLKEEADSAQLRTIGLYSAGAVLVGTGIALWLVDWSPEGEAGATVRAEAGWEGDGPSVRGVIRW